MRPEHRTQSLLLLVGTAVIVAVVVPVVGYFSTLSRSTDPSPPDPSPPSGQTTQTVSRTTTIWEGAGNSGSSGSSSATGTSSSAVSSSLVDPGDLNDIEQRLLAHHNELRTLHGAPNMTWNWELTEFAADYAANNFSCENVELIHSGGPYGENLAAGYVGGESPVQAWYDEIELYDYDNPEFTVETGHFTQLIWDTSVELGCAIVMCDNAWRQYTICQYYPRGNIVGNDEESTAEIFTEHVWPLVDE